MPLGLGRCPVPPSRRPPRGTIVAGAGTGDRASLRGTVEIEHDDQGARFTFAYEID